MSKAVIGIGNAVNKAATKYPIINTALNNPIKSGVVIGVAGGAIVVGGVLAAGGAITCGAVCPAAIAAGGSIAGTAARFGNTIKDTATKIGNSANSLVQKGSNTATKVGGSPVGQNVGSKVANGLKLGQDFGKLGTVIENASGKITLINNHALEKATVDLIKEVVINPATRLIQPDGRVLYLSEKGVAVLDNAGRVITAYSRSYFEADILSILSKIIK